MRLCSKRECKEPKKKPKKEKEPIPSSDEALEAQIRRRAEPCLHSVKKMLCKDRLTQFLFLEASWEPLARSWPKMADFSTNSPLQDGCGMG